MVPFHKRGKSEMVELYAGDLEVIEEESASPSRRPSFPSPPSAAPSRRSQPAPRAMFEPLRIPMEPMGDAETQVFESEGPRSSAPPSRGRSTPPPARASSFPNNTLLSSGALLGPLSTGPISVRQTGPVSTRAPASRRSSAPPAPISHGLMNQGPKSLPNLFQTAPEEEYTSLRPPHSTADLGEVAGRERPLIGRAPASPMSTMSTAPLAFTSPAELATKVRPAIKRVPVALWAGGGGGFVAMLLLVLLSSADGDAIVSGAANLVDSTGATASHVQDPRGSFDSRSTDSRGVDPRNSDPRNGDPRNVAPMGVNDPRFARLNPAGTAEAPLPKPFENALRPGAPSAYEAPVNFIQPRVDGTAATDPAGTEAPISASNLPAAGSPTGAVVTPAAVAPTPVAPVVVAPTAVAPIVAAPVVVPPAAVAPVAPKPAAPAKAEAPRPAPARHYQAPPPSKSNSAASKLADEQLKAALGN